MNSRDFFLEITGNEIISINGDYILAYKINYPEKYSQREEDFKNFSQEWVKFCQNLPIGTILLKSDLYLKKDYDNRIEEKTYLHKTLNDHFQGRSQIVHNGYLFIVTPVNNTLNNWRCQNPFTINSKKSFLSEDYEREKTKNIIDQAISLLGERLAPLTESDIVQYSDYYFNGFQDNYFTPSFIEKSAISADNKKIGIFYIPNEFYLPDTLNYSKIDSKITPADSDYKFFMGFMDEFGVTANYDHLYNQVIFIDDNQRHIQLLKKQEENLYGFKSLGSSNSKAAANIKKVLKVAAQSDSFRFVRGFTSLTFWADNETEFKFLSNQIATSFKSSTFKPVLAIKHSLREVFLNSFFTNISMLSNEHLYLTSLDVCCCLFTLNTTYKNDNQGVYLTDRIYNTPICYDFWDYSKKRKNSRNFAIIAETGYGKSFFSMNLFFQLFSEGVKLIILDMGGSYIKMAHLFPPEKVAIINLKKGEPIGDNPFTVYPGEKIASKIESVADFVHLLLYAKHKPSELQEVSLRKILYSYYNVIESNYSFESFYNYISSNQENIYEIADIPKNSQYFSLDEFLHLGSEYIGTGIYSRMLKVDTEHQNSLKDIYSKNLIIYELDDIGDDERTVQIALMAIKETIRRVVWEDRTTPAIIHFEEFAKQLKVPEILLAVEYYTQTARKYNGSVGIVLQTVDQLPDTTSSKAILANIETYILLNKGSVATADKRLHFSSHALVQLNSLQSNFSDFSKINYSEIYIHNHKTGGLVYRVEVSPQAYLAFQTEGDLYELILFLYSQIGDMEKVIELFLREERKNPKLREILKKKYAEIKAQSKPIEEYTDFLALTLNNN